MTIMRLSPEAKQRLLSDGVRRHLRFAAAAGYSPATVEVRRDVLFRVTCEVGDLDTRTVDDLAGWLGRDGWRPKTRATYFLHLRGYYRWAVDTGRLAGNPMATMATPRVTRGVPKPVPEAQLEEVLRVAPEWLRTAALIAAYAGLRCCELAALLREEITETEILVRSGKGGKAAVIPCHARIWQAVEALPPGPVLRRADGGPFTARQLSRRAVEWFGEHGFPKVSLHMFRHRFGTLVYRRTKDILLTSRMLRHSSVETTMVYTQLDDDAARDAIGLI